MESVAEVEIQNRVKEAYDLLNKFIKKAKASAVRHPFMVVILMHEYFRNIYPNDPFIEKKFSDDKLDNIILCLKFCNEMLEKVANLGNYFNSINNLIEYSQNELRDTQSVYGRLWELLQEDYINNESTKVLVKLLEKGGKNIGFLKGKKVLDMGCGSGRFSIALAKLGVAEVTAVDLGKHGISIGKRMCTKLKINNVNFVVNDVLDLPFENESFDFVWCKGVLHHTGNLSRGIDEFHRVLKKGGNAFLYLYGKGGIFWDSRALMRGVFEKIPMSYTLSVLDMIGMPPKRYIFADSWYVPIEEHTGRDWLVKYLSARGYQDIRRLEHTGTGNLDPMYNLPYTKEIWGDGDLRYFLTK